MTTKPWKAKDDLEPDIDVVKNAMERLGCCGFPHGCGAACMDTRDAQDAAILVQEIKRLEAELELSATESMEQNDNAIRVYDRDINALRVELAKAKQDHTEWMYTTVERYEARVRELEAELAKAQREAAKWHQKTRQLDGAEDRQIGHRQRAEIERDAAIRRAEVAEAELAAYGEPETEQQTDWVRTADNNSFVYRVVAERDTRYTPWRRVSVGEAKS